MKQSKKHKQKKPRAEASRAAPNPAPALSPSRSLSTRAPVAALKRNVDLILAAAAACLFTAHFWTDQGWFLGSGTDIISLEVPLHAMAGSRLALGELPLWNPFIFGGIPFQAGVHGLLYPGFWSAPFLEAGVDIKLFIAFHLMLAAAGGAWFVRPDCRSVVSRVLMGTVFALSAFSILHLFAGHRILVACAAYIPWVGGAARRIALGEKRAVFPGAVIAGLMMLVGHYQMVYIAGWGLLLWLVAERLAEPSRPNRLRGAALTAAACTGLFAIGALLAAVQLLPALSLTGLSQRPGDDAAFAASFSASPAALWCYVLPRFFGDKATLPFVGPFSFWESVGYLGIIPLFLLLLSTIVLPVRRFLPSLAVILLALLIGMGAHTPLFDLYLTLPGADLFRAPGRSAVLVALFGARLAALCLDTLIYEPQRIKRILSANWGLVAVVAAGAATLFFSDLDAASAWQQQQFSAGAHPDAATLDRLSAALRDDARLALVLFIAGGVAVTAAVLRPRFGRAAAVVLLLLTAGDLYRFSRDFLVLGSPDRFAFPPKIEAALEAAKQPGRRMIAPIRSRMMNHAARFDMGTPAGYDIFIDRRYAEFLNRSQGRRPDTFISMERLRRGNRLTRRMGADLLLSRVPPRNGRSTAAHGHPGFDFIAAEDGVHLFRDPAPEPRAAVVHAVETFADKDALFGRLASGAFDMRKSVLLEAPLPEGFPPPSIGAGGTDRVVITDYTPNRVALDVTADGPGVLVLSDTLMPGWSAEVDGRPVPMVHGNWVMRALPVPSGRSRVIMRYLPRSFVIGAAISLSMLLMLVGLFVRERRRRRRRTTDPS